MADPTGFEPAIFPVTGGRVDQATPRVHDLFWWLGWGLNPDPPRRTYESSLRGAELPSFGGWGGD